MLDKKVVDKWLNRFPILENFIDAGTISMKRAREILDIDRYLMKDIYGELLVAGAIRACSSNTWRATPELKEYLKERRGHID